MNPTTTKLALRLRRLTREWEAWKLYRARREHDVAMADPRLAAEHYVQIGRNVERGEPGCRFCT
jgi:hypothetical protein